MLHLTTEVPNNSADSSFHSLFYISHNIFAGKLFKLANELGPCKTSYTLYCLMINVFVLRSRVTGWSMAAFIACAAVLRLSGS